MLKKLQLFALILSLFSSFSINAFAVPLPDNPFTVNGTNQYARIPYNNVLEFTTGTIEMWVRPDWVAGSVSANLCLVAERENRTRYSFHINKNLDAIGLYNNNSYGTIRYNFTQGVWYHIAFVMTNINTEIFINGVSIGLTGNTINTNITGLPVKIGTSEVTGNLAGNEYFKGAIDEVRIWNTTRTQNQIQANMSNSIAANSSGLIAYYPVDAGVTAEANRATRILKDYTANGFNGTLYNYWDAAVATGNASSVTVSSAVINGDVTDDGGNAVTERGIVYSSGNNVPTVTDTKVTAGNGRGEFAAGITGLAAHTSYYARAYATNSLGTFYGSAIQFTTKADQTITFNQIPAKTYGDADFDPGATASSGLAVLYTSSNPNVAAIVNNQVHIAGTGSVNITASQPGDNNYTAAAAVTQNLTVNKALLTITATNQTKTYGTANPELTAGYAGFVNGETSNNLTTKPAITTSATTTSSVGSYPINVSGAVAANYQITYVNGSLSVYPGIQTITFVTSPRTYGEPDFALSATASSGLQVLYSSSNTAVATVNANGQVHIVAAGNVTITASQPGNGNFIATTNINQQLTINKAVLIVKADDLTKVYGTANPPLTINYTGFVYADSRANLTAQPFARTAVTDTSAAGIYPVTVGGAAALNYSFVYQAGTLTVEQKSQEITFASLPDKFYGDADFTLTGNSTSGLPLVYTSNDPSVAGVDAAGTVHILTPGIIKITASQPGNENYSGAEAVDQILTVNKAPLMITADNQNKTYGTANPALTFTYSGFVNSENNTVLTTLPTITTTAEAASVAGVYPITISEAAAANYDITFTPGTLTIAKAALTVTADDKSRVYGLANPVFTATYSGFVNNETIASLNAEPQFATTANTASPAGIYPITMSGGSAANYDFTFVPGALTVTNATVNSISLAQLTLLENQPAGTPAGTLTAASLDPAAVYTYSLVAGTGAADNALFAIAGNRVVTARSLDYEQKSGYSILLRATNQYGLYLDQVFSINIVDVNEAPTLAAIPNQTVCYTSSTQNISLSGITGGPESTQTSNLSVSSTNTSLFKNLSVSTVSGGTATLNYQLAASGTAVITVTNQDNGGTANGGTDSFSQTFTITADDMPVASVTAAQGTQILKGQTVTLTATGGTTYSWDNAFGITGSTNAATLQVRPNQTTIYQVKVSNASGCSAIASITINVADDYSSIHPANILTPNGDGKNDTWVVKNIDLYPNNTVSIFDRGGRKLKEVKGYNNDWDGTLNGSQLAEGTYYYVIDFGSGVPVKGFITILRNR